MDPDSIKPNQIDLPNVGKIVEVVVTQIEFYGAWFDWNGRSGLVTIPEVSWTRISHPAEAVTVGKKIKVKILVATPTAFAASIRQVNPEQNPWYDPTPFAVGNVFEGKVEKVLVYGCFIELRPHVVGLLRRDDWPHELAVGDIARVRIARSNSESKQIDLEWVPG